MVNKTKILSDLSKIAFDAMDTFSGMKKEIETIVKIRVNKAVNKMNLVQRDEFEALRKSVQKLASSREKYKKKARVVAKKKKKT